MMPNTPSASETGRVACTAWKVSVDVTRKICGPPAECVVIACLTAATSASPLRNTRPCHAYSSRPFASLHERGREQDERGSVGVVLRDLFDERTDADDRRVDEQAGLRVLQQFRIRVLDVVSAHDAEIEALTDVIAVAPSGLLVDDDFVRPRRVRAAAP